MKLLEEKKILVVDDEPELREILADEFSSQGAVSFQASNGIEAFEIAKAENVSAVVSDIRMPGGNGLDLLRNLKGENPRRPVVMLITGFADLSPAEAYDIGAEAYLSKPFRLSELRLTLARLLDPDYLFKNSFVVGPNPLKRSWPSVTKSFAEKGWQLGRGGIFLPGEFLSTANTTVDFSLEFQQENASLIGQGNIRWRRNTAAPEGTAKNGIGIEILALNGSSKHIWDEMQKNIAPKAYIPKE